MTSDKSIQTHIYHICLEATLFSLIKKLTHCNLVQIYSRFTWVVQMYRKAWRMYRHDVPKKLNFIEMTPRIPKVKQISQVKDLILF